MRNHYYYVNIAPSLEELNNLEQSTGECKKEIKKWLATQRFKNKVKNNFFWLLYASIVKLCYYFKRLLFFEIK